LYPSNNKELSSLKYKNANSILPKRLVEELVKYAGGDLIYVPRSGSAKAKWGEITGAREIYAQRNSEIIRSYRNGTEVGEIADRFHLSDYSIRKIVRGSGRVGR
jgi:Mor family transcriptional regulator